MLPLLPPLEHWEAVVRAVAVEDVGYEEMELSGVAAASKARPGIREVVKAMPLVEMAGREAPKSDSYRSPLQATHTRIHSFRCTAP